VCSPDGAKRNPGNAGINPGLSASLILRAAALRTFNALRAFVRPVGLHPGYFAAIAGGSLVGGVL
jgi:hypothetical protein